MNPICPERIELECGPVTAVDLSLYAAASGDRNPLHLESAVAQAAGFDRPLLHGMLTMAYCGRLLTSQFGVSALRSLSARFLGTAARGERVIVSGSLNGIEDGVATYALVARSDAGKELVTGTARVAAQTGQAES